MGVVPFSSESVANYFAWENQQAMHKKHLQGMPCCTSTKKKPQKGFCVSTFIPLSVLFNQCWSYAYCHRFFANTFDRVENREQERRLAIWRTKLKTTKVGMKSSRNVAPFRMSQDEERILTIEDSPHISKLLAEILAYGKVGLTTPFE